MNDMTERPPSNQDPLDELLAVSRGPAGPAVEPEFDFRGPVWRELEYLLSRSNGFFVFNAGIQVFRLGPVGLGPDAQTWNAPDTWKTHYGGLAQNLFCFAQDLLGNQFGIDENGVVVQLAAETGDREVLGSVADWASWLLADPAQRGMGALATEWQDTFGALDPAERLLPRRFLVLGGSWDLRNFEVCESAKAMRIRGPIAQQVHGLPDGATVELSVD